MPLACTEAAKEAPDLPEVPITEEDDGILQTEEVLGVVIGGEAISGGSYEVPMFIWFF